MGTRLELHSLLQSLQDGMSVYFQPPVNVSITYPAIIYSRDYEAVEFADNLPYARKIRWQVMVIDPDPDSPIPDKVAELPMTRYVRHFTTENLNHDIYDVYF